MNECHNYSLKEISKTIDHAILRPNMTVEEMTNSIYKGIKLDVASICIMPNYLPLCVSLIRKAGTSVLPSTVIGFPHGNVSLHCKQLEIEQALNAGAAEVDMVVQISNVVSNNWASVTNEITEVYKQCQSAHAVLKIIFENCYLDQHQKIVMCEICSEVMGSGFVKTSTGFGTSGATISDIELMRKHTKGHLGVKASGGIKTLKQVIDFKIAGATRCGCSSTDEILAEVVRTQDDISDDLL
jgi:deoxyribose-phosphate aldolase